MADITNVGKEYKYQKRGPKPGTMTRKPRDKKLVLEVIRLRDEERLTWREIGKLIKRSHQSPHLLYYRWKDRKDAF